MNALHYAVTCPVQDDSCAEKKSSAAVLSVCSRDATAREGHTCGVVLVASDPQQCQYALLVGGSRHHPSWTIQDDKKVTTPAASTVLAVQDPQKPPSQDRYRGIEITPVGFPNETSRTGHTMTSLPTLQLLRSRAESRHIGRWILIGGNVAKEAQAAEDVCILDVFDRHHPPKRDLTAKRGQDTARGKCDRLTVRATPLRTLNATSKIETSLSSRCGHEGGLGKVQYHTAVLHRQRYIYILGGERNLLENVTHGQLSTWTISNACYVIDVANIEGGQEGIVYKICGANALKGGTCTPRAVTHHTCVVWKDTYMVRYGGITSVTPLDSRVRSRPGEQQMHYTLASAHEVEMYTFETNQWCRMEETHGTVPSTPRARHASVCVGDRMYVHGGMQLSNHHTGGVWTWVQCDVLHTLCLQTMFWTSIQLYMEHPIPSGVQVRLQRSDHTLAVVDSDPCFGEVSLWSYGGGGPPLRHPSRTPLSNLAYQTHHTAILFRSTKLSGRERLCSTSPSKRSVLGPRLGVIGCCTTTTGASP